MSDETEIREFWLRRIAEPSFADLPLVEQIEYLRDQRQRNPSGPKDAVLLEILEQLGAKGEPGAKARRIAAERIKADEEADLAAQAQQVARDKANRVQQFESLHAGLPSHLSGGPQVVEYCTLRFEVIAVGDEWHERWTTLGPGPVVSVLVDLPQRLVEQADGQVVLNRLAESGWAIRSRSSRSFVAQRPNTEGSTFGASADVVVEYVMERKFL